MPSDPPPDPWRMRASDADRDAYVAALQRAYLEGRLTKDEYDERTTVALSAGTYADLAPLVSDLPLSPGEVPMPPARATVPAPSMPAATSSSPMVAVFSEVRRDSRWTVADGDLALAVFGSVKLDLTQAQLGGDDNEIRANAFFGQVELTVPGDIEVEVDGVGVFGEYCRKDRRTAPTHTVGPPHTVAPRLRVTGIAMFGSVEVTVVDEPVTGRDRVIDPPGPAIGT